MPRPFIKCVCCGEEGSPASRGLRSACFDAHAAAGTLEDYPPLHRPTRDILEDWETYKARGMTKRQASVAMGMQPKSLQQMLARYRRMGIVT